MFVTGVLLAAGAAARFGSPKMLAPVPPEGRPLLAHVIDTWRGAGMDDLLVVLGCGADDIRAGIERREGSSAPRVRFVENPRWSSGMFSSVKAGLAAASPLSTHLALSPADLPFLSKETLRAVLDAAASLDERSIAVPTHARRRGHPLVVPASLRDRILSWPDTDRLNRIFAEPDIGVRHLEGFDDSILRDVDRPPDLLARPQRPPTSPI